MAVMLLIIRVTVTVRDHLLELLLSKRQVLAREDMEKREPSVPFVNVGNVKRCSHHRKQYEVSSKN